MEQIQYIAVDRITANPQVRKVFDLEALEGLAASLQEVGQLQPLRVRMVGDKFIIVDGERRYRAAKLAALETLAVIVEGKDLCESELLQRQLMANCQREDLSPIEKAKAITQLMEVTGWKVGEAAGKLGMSAGMATKLLGILKLPEPILLQVTAGNLVGLFTTVLEISERNKSGGGREEDGYWKRTNRQLLRNSLELLVQAKGAITTPELYRLVVSAPTSFEQLQSDAWRASSFCYQCLKEADAKVTPERRDDLQLATDFFCLEWPQLSEKTRSIVLSTLTSMLDVLNRGVVRELLSPTETTVRPEMACDGKIILVDMPLKLFGEVGLFVQTVWKYCFQQAMERRDVASNPRPVFIVVDESHLLATSSDQVFQTTARSSRTAVVYATQSISNYLAAFGGEQPKARSAYVSSTPMTATKIGSCQVLKTTSLALHFSPRRHGKPLYCECSNIPRLRRAHMLHR